MTDTKTWTETWIDTISETETVIETLTDTLIDIVVEDTLPAAALPVLEEPEMFGCPALLDAAALELGMTTETIQVSIQKAVALAPNIQPCEACEMLMNSALVLKDPDGIGMAAMAQIFNQIAPADMPPSDEMFASIALAFENNSSDPQFATALAHAEAFVQYIAAMDELGAPVDDSTAYALDKYGQTALSENPNIAAYIMMLLGS